MTDSPFHNPDTSEWGDVDVRLKNVRFGVHQSYKDNDGNMPVCMIFDMVNDLGATRDDQLLSIGAGYKAVDGGKAVEHERAKYNKGEGLGFSRNSKGATLLDSLVKVGRDELIERAAKTGGPRNAPFWEGMCLHLVEEVVEWGKPDEDGKRKSFRQPVATALYGWDVEFPDDDDDDDGPTLPPAAQAKAKGPGKGSGSGAAAPVTAADFGLDEAAFDQLVELVRSSKNYEDFMAAAYDLDCIGSAAVQAAVDDDLNGIWGKLQ